MRARQPAGAVPPMSMPAHHPGEIQPGCCYVNISKQTRRLRRSRGDRFPCRTDAMTATVSAAMTAGMTLACIVAGHVCTERSS